MTRETASTSPGWKHLPPPLTDGHSPRWALSSLLASSTPPEAISMPGAAHLQFPAKKCPPFIPGRRKQEETQTARIQMAQAGTATLRVGVGAGGAARVRV